MKKILHGIGLSLGLMLMTATRVMAFTGATDSMRGDHIQVQIVSRELSLRPGATQTFALRFQPDPHWHVYWKNPGDSGEAPRLQWQKPEGWTVSDFTWPMPTRIPVGPFHNIGYEGEVILPFSVSVPADISGGPVALDVLVKWLVCEEECIPGQHLFSWSMPLNPSGTVEASLWGPVLEKSVALAPQGRVFAKVSEIADGGSLQIEIADSQITSDLKLVNFFPDEGSGLKSAPPALKDRRITLEKTLEPATRPLGGLAVFETADGQKLAYELDLNAVTAAGGNLWMILGLAFLGGLILNIMPCVLPVLAIKVLSLVRESGADVRKVRLGSLAYGAGVLLSFLLLAGVLLVLKAGGEAVGWGFQLQSPAFIAVLALLFFIMALNFLDLIQPWNAFTRLGQVGNTQSGPTGQFFSGVLAVVVASPCTGPFMGVAVGSALTRTPGESLLIFSGIGLGFLSPFLALAWIPGSRRLLPKPGMWMETLRQAMAFPLLLTILWLLWVLEQQSGMRGVLWILGTFIGLGFLAWFWLQRANKSRSLAWSLAGFMVLLSGLAVSQQKPSATRTAAAVQNTDVWKPFTREALEVLRKEGPVFVDFTAAWCVTCQVNKTLVLNRGDVLKAFEDHGVRLMRADWTDYNPAITQMLESLGRQGVPVYALYKDAASEPLLLPEVLTPDLLLKEIQQLSPYAGRSK